MELFERASKSKTRFVGTNSVMTVEDLWDLPLTTTKAQGTSLETIAQKLYGLIQNASTPNFVGKQSSSSTEMDFKLDIVKRVIEVKIAAADKVKAGAASRKRKAAIREELISRENNDLEGASDEALLKELGEEA